MPKLWIDWPIGTPEERLAASGQRLPGLWQNVNPFNNPYRLGNSTTINAIHTGVDLDLNSPRWNSDAGMPIYSPCNGLVTYSGLGGGTWGWLIVVSGQDDMGNVFYCRMAHVNHKQFKVPMKGSVVTMGQEIALVGNADGVYANGGDHLHFDVCYTPLLAQHPNDWPGMNQAYLLANYADPVEIIKHQTLPQVPVQEILTVTADGDGLRLRSGPGVKYTAITSFRAGTKLTLTETVINGSDVWRKVIAPKVGYSAEKYKGGVYLAPVVPPPPPEPQFKTKWGLHVIWGGDYNAIEGMARDGILPGITNMKYAGRGDALSNQKIKAASKGRTKILNRWYNEHDPLIYPDWNKDDLTAEGASLCQQYYDLYLASDPDSLLADWHQLFNEPTSIGHGPGMASFWLGAMKKAEQLGIRLAIGCFSERFPPLPGEAPEFWIPFFDVLRYAKAHGHVYMIHGYLAPDPGGSWTNSPSMLRHRLELTPADLRDMPTIYAEYGTAYGAGIDDDSYIAGINASDAELMKDPAVLFVSGWTAGGGGGWPRSNINGKLPRIIQRAKALA